jgi:hypothetical protein
MMLRKPEGLGPGEVRSRQRARRQLAYLLTAGAVGGVIGLITGTFDEGDGNLFAGNWAALALDPAVAILLAVLLAFGLVALPLYGFRTIDELKRAQSLIGFTGGALAVLAGFPIWAVLHAGGLGAAPHPSGVWLLAFVGMGLSYLYALWRH